MDKESKEIIERIRDIQNRLKNVSLKEYKEGDKDLLRKIIQVLEKVLNFLRK
ncbi:MAG: hypothetical protein ACJ0G4_07040 [Alphaproteobacteria bacterium]|tara:strand:+ start:419 stop:574 length:156 start_codon:yes stop_codon:yes gene_type:complete